MKFVIVNNFKEELKILRQQQADYIDHLQHLSDHEPLHTTSSSGTRSRNAEGKPTIYLFVTS